MNDDIIALLASATDDGRPAPAPVARRTDGQTMKYARSKHARYGAAPPVPARRVPQMPPGTENNQPSKRTPEQLAERKARRDARKAARKAARR